MEKIKNSVREYHKSLSLGEKRAVAAQRGAIVLILIAVGITFFCFNNFTHLRTDDFSYSFSFATGERISSVSDILASLKAHYGTINGRLVAHFLAHFFLMLDKSVFNIVNTFVFLALGVLIYFHSGYGRKKRSPAWLAAVFAMLYLFTPAYGQSFLWITGASNYLYGLVFALAFLLPYRLAFDCEEKRRNIFSEIIFAVLNLAFGVVAGNAVENTAAGLLFSGIAAVVAIKTVFKKKFRLWMFSGIIGVAGGFLLALMGNSGRIEMAGGLGSVLSWIKEIFFISFNLVETFAALILFFVAALTVYAFSTKGKKIKALTSCLVYLIGAAAATYSMIISPFFPERAWTAPMVLFIIAMGNIVVKTDFSISFRFWSAKSVIAAVLAVCALGGSVKTFYLLRNYSADYTALVQSIEAKAEQGDKIIYISNLSYNSKYCCTFGIGSDPNAWPNAAIADYFGIDEIRLSR